MPEPRSHDQTCSNNCSNIGDDDEIAELLDDVNLRDTEELLVSDDALKHKVVFVAGHLVHKHGKETEISDSFNDDEEDDMEVSSEFLDNLNRGGLSFPKMSTVHFVHVGHVLRDKTNLSCRFHLCELLSNINAPMASSKAACKTLANILMKAHVLNVSDKGKAVCCLRRQEKLSA